MSKCYKLEIMVHDALFEGDIDAILGAVTDLVYSEQFSHLDVSTVGRPADSCNCVGVTRGENSAHQA